MWEFHFGGDNPVPGKWVEAIMEDGSYVKSFSDNLRWTHSGLSYGVERYRISYDTSGETKITNLALGAN
jgi:hypothetical protein